VLVQNLEQVKLTKLQANGGQRDEHSARRFRRGPTRCACLKPSSRRWTARGAGPRLPSIAYASSAPPRSCCRRTTNEVPSVCRLIPSSAATLSWPTRSAVLPSAVRLDFAFGGTMCVGAGGEHGTQRVRGVVACQACARGDALRGACDGARADALVLDLCAVHDPKQRPGRAPYPCDPCSQSFDGTSLARAATRDVRVSTPPELVFLRAP
jgi:hypothetical protein